MILTSFFPPFPCFHTQTLSEITVTIEEEEAKTEKGDKKILGWDPTKPLYMATKDVATLFGGFASAAIYLSVWAIPCGILFVLFRTFCWKTTAYCVSEITDIYRAPGEMKK